MDKPGERSGSGQRRSADFGLSMRDFLFLRCLSIGGASRVFLCERKDGGEKVAVKAMRKADVQRKNSVHRVWRERAILSITSHPFIVPMYYAIASRHHLYLVMEYMRGGDLADFLHTSTTRPSAAFVRSVLAEVTLSLRYLHSLGIVHRDVKPQNICLDATGHVKLTDFGLSKHIPPPRPLPAAPRSAAPRASSARDGSGSDSGSATPSPTSSASTSSSSSSCSPSSSSPHSHGLMGEGAALLSGVGTAEYLAPEMVLGVGHDAAVDWWSLGVLAFEMLCGYTPFHAESAEAIYERIIERDISWPAALFTQLSVDAYDLIDRLLCLDPAKRLGSGGARDIEQHPFFAGVQWDVLMQQKAVSEPTIAGPHPRPSEGVQGSARRRSTSPSASAWPLRAAHTVRSSARAATPPRGLPTETKREDTAAGSAASYWGGPSHVPSSRTRSATSSITRDANQPSPTDQQPPPLFSEAAPAVALTETPVTPPPATPPSKFPVARTHLLTALPAWSASAEFSAYSDVDSSSPSPEPFAVTPERLPSVPSYLTSLAPTTTDLSFSSLSLFPSLSDASSSLLSSLSVPTILPTALTASAGPPPSAATQSSLDRLHFLTASAAQKQTRASYTSPQPSPPAASLSEGALSRGDETVEEEDDEEGLGVDEAQEDRTRTRERPHSGKGRRKSSSSATFSSRTLRSPFASQRSVRLSPPGAQQQRAVLRSPPTSRRPRKPSLTSPPSAVHSVAHAPSLSASSSDADHADADSETEDSAAERRRRRSQGGVSPSVQGRAMRHYARKSPEIAARLAISDPIAEQKPLPTDRVLGRLGGGGGDAEDEVVLAGFVEEVDSGPGAAEERSQSESGSEFVEARRVLDGRDAVSRVLLNGGGWSGSELSSDWSVGSEDEFKGFAWRSSSPHVASTAAPTTGHYTP